MSLAVRTWVGLLIAACGREPTYEISGGGQACEGDLRQQGRDPLHVIYIHQTFACDKVTKTSTLRTERELYRYAGSQCASSGTIAGQTYPWIAFGQPEHVEPGCEFDVGGGLARLVIIDSGQEQLYATLTRKSDGETASEPLTCTRLGASFDEEKSTEKTCEDFARDIGFEWTETP